MVAVGQVDTLQQLQLGEEVERTENRSPADAELLLLGLGDEVVGSEVARALADELGHDTPGLGQPIAGRAQGLDEWFGRSHRLHHTDTQSH